MTSLLFKLLLATALIDLTPTSIPLSTLDKTPSTLQIGDLVFSEFVYFHYNEMPTAENVMVSGFQTAPNQWGISFVGDFKDNPYGYAAGGRIWYTVSTTDPNKRIVEAELDAAGLNSNDDQNLVLITQRLSYANTTNAVADLSFVAVGETVERDGVGDVPSLGSLFSTTSFYLAGYGHAVARIGGVQQSFTLAAVPESPTLLLGVLGTALAVLVRLRAKLIGLALAVVLVAPSYTHAQNVLVMDWIIANSGPGDDFGSVGWVRPETGWPGFLDTHVKPAVKWCQDSGVTPIVAIHHPFGQYSEQLKRSNGDGVWDGRDVWEPMHLDGWDYAKAANATWLINNFSTLNGWKSVTPTVDCYCYVGGMDITPRLRNLSPSEFAATVKRNLKPMDDAGFKGIYIDAAANALNSMYIGVNPDQTNGRSLDTITLRIADSMFPVATGIEAAPREYPAFRHLHTRNVWCDEGTWRQLFEPTPNRALGFNDRVLKGKIWRRLNYSDNVPGIVADAQAIVADGHTPIVSPQPLIKAGIKASDLFKGAN